MLQYGATLKPLKLSKLREEA